MQHAWEANEASQGARASNQPVGPSWLGAFQGRLPLPITFSSSSIQSDQLPAIGSLDFTLRGLPTSSISHSRPGSEWMHQQSYSLLPPPTPRGQYSPLPLVTHPDPHLNPILFPRQGLIYDVRSGPLSARFTFAEVGECWRDQAATVPSVPFMTIVSSRFAGPLVVLPMVSTSDKVTVLDVLFAVYKRAHQMPQNPATFSLLEPVGHRVVASARRDVKVPNWQARPYRDGGGVRFGSNAVASGNGVGVNSAEGWDPSVYEEGWMWVGIMPSKNEQGVWVLELR